MARSLKSPLSIFSDCQNFVSILEYRACEQPGDTAFSFLTHGEVESSSLSYRDLSVKARSIAACMQSIVVAGERALLLFPPGLDFISAFFGCLYAGVIAVPAYPPRKNQHLSRIQSIIEDAEASVILSTSAYLSRLTQQGVDQISSLSDMQWLATDIVDIELQKNWQQTAPSGNAIALLQYTSGSTGSPKGVMISHGNLVQNSRVIHACFGHEASSCGVIWLPPYHDMGLIGGVLQPLYGGFPVVLMSAVDFLQKPIRWLKAISRFHATTSGGPNFAYELCLQRLKPEHLNDLDLSSWEVAFTGAEPIQVETLDKFARIFEPCGFRPEAFYPCYGMAEATLLISGGEKRELPVLKRLDKEALGNHLVMGRDSECKGGEQTVIGCGKTPVDQIIAVVEPETLTPCKASQVGEIWVSGPSVAQGYWKNSKETQAVFRNYLPEVGEQPFLRTGDLGFIEEGELFITGRIRDLIIIRGQNYYPQDIEKTVEKSHPSLRKNSTAVFSIQEKGNEQLVVVNEIKRTHLRKLDVQSVMGSIRHAITANHSLQTFAIVLVKPGSIPKTSSGKIRRQACRTAFLKGELVVVEDWSEDPQLKAEYVNLNAEIYSISQKLSSIKGQSYRV